MGIFKKKANAADNATPNGSVSSTTLFAIKEAYKTIRTNLILNLEDKPCHTIAIY